MESPQLSPIPEVELDSPLVSPVSSPVSSPTPKCTLKGPSLRRPKLTRSSAKDVILDAVDFLEKENEELRRSNIKLCKDMEAIKEENQRLQKELQNISSEKNVFLQKIEDIGKESQRLKEDLILQTSKWQETTKEKDKIRTQLLSENTKKVKQIENLKNEIIKKDAELRRRDNEAENLRQKIVVKTRQTFEEIRVELVSEVEVLKSERKDLTIQKEELIKINEKLKSDFQALEGKIEEQVSELRNENRRHSLLTKEFNSLLEENNRLKQQMRRRTHENVNTNITSISEEANKSEASPDKKLSRRPSLPNELRRSNTAVSLKSGTKAYLTEGLPILSNIQLGSYSWKP